MKTLGTFTLVLKFISVLIFVFSLGIPVESVTIKNNKGEPRVSCLTDLSDFPVPWIDAPQTSVKYARNSSELPGIFQGHELLKGEGIKYYAPTSDGVTFAIRLNELPIDSTSPVFLYIKYYAHVGANGNRNRNSFRDITVVPVLKSDSNNVDVQKQLEITSNFTWVEEFMQLRGDTEYVFQLVIRGFHPEDIFLIKELILSQGIVINEISEIVSLCNVQ